MTTAFIAVGYVMIAIALAGWVTFRWLYKPWRSRGHSRTGQHLIRTADSMIALLGVSLVAAVLPIPLPVMGVITLLVLAGICWVAWERVYLLRWERSRRRAREAEADIEDTA